MIINIINDIIIINKGVIIIKAKYILIIILVILLIISIISIILINKNKSINNKSIPDIKSFSFSYTTGYSINARVRYEIEYKSNEYIVTILPNEIPDEDKLEIKLEKKEIKNIIKILNKYNVSNWNGFDKVDKNVLDGDSFHIYIETLDNDKVSASGYMKWPKNYNNVRDELDNIFMNIYNNGGDKNE